MRASTGFRGPDEKKGEKKKRNSLSFQKKKKNQNRRLVDEYRRSGPGQSYELVLEGVEFSKYMREHRGFHIIPISGDVSFFSSNVAKFLVS